ncbi:MAG: secondary thiamine-phosphate synthase enzyme YjbQ [Gammaproteobacteria bacterium]|nr:secondary thiamine-phosphate synthase enzyme YjbQ [Gammaproteobacteria bacterium]
MNLKLNLQGNSQGLSDITQEVAAAVRGCGVRDGLATLYIRHTSASLLIQENADPSVQRDLEHWLNRLVPEDDALYTHTAEGPDDMPAHIKSALTATSLSIPVVDGELALGTWQGIFLWEHRHHRGERQLLINVLAGQSGR